jgi:hypothetical protein
VDGTEVGVLKKSNHVSLRCLLESKDGGALEPQVVLELGSDFSDESLERKFPDEELGALLELSDFSECDCSRSESVWLLDTFRRGGFLGLFMSDVFSGDFASGIFPCSLFGAGHLCLDCLNFELLLLKLLNYLFRASGAIFPPIGSGRIRSPPTKVLNA